MRVFVHIGHYKCGTTALQRRLTSQRTTLADQGVLYPKLDLLRDGPRPLPNHSTLAFEMLRSRRMPVPPWYRERREDLVQAPDIHLVRERMEGILTEANEMDADVILSSEEFMRFADGPESDGLVEELLAILGGAEVTAFAHLRRPDAHMPSFYNQLVKLGSAPTNLSLNLGTSLRSIHHDYAHALRPWVEVLGADRVIVRRYEQRRGDITDDMLAGLGLDIELPTDSQRWENERFPDIYVETLRRWNRLLPPRPLSEQVMATATMLAETTHAEVKVDLLTSAARDDLCTRFVSIDAALTELLELDSSLFPDLPEIAERDPDALSDIDAHNQFGTELLDQALGERQARVESGQDNAPPGASKAPMRKRLETKLRRWLR